MHYDAVRQAEEYRKVLWSSGRKLFSQIWDEGKKTLERTIFWLAA